MSHMKFGSVVFQPLLAYLAPRNCGFRYASCVLPDLEMLDHHGTRIGTHSSSDCVMCNMQYT